MTSQEFINKAKELVSKEASNKEVHLVWFCKTLQNFKALLITISPDNFYYEVTYNGDKEEFYFDKYVKVKNEAIK